MFDYSLIQKPAYDDALNWCVENKTPKRSFQMIAVADAC